MEKKINGNHASAEIFLPPVPADIPEQLKQLKSAFTKWAQPSLQLVIGARINDGLTRPKVELHKVWPQFVAWMLSDETYGMLQFFDGNKKLTDIGMEVVRLLNLRGRGEEVHEQKFLELGEELLPYGERLTDKDNVAAGAAWQAMFGACMNDAELTVRYAIAANQQGQPGDNQVALLATINVYRKKFFELLKV